MLVHMKTSTALPVLIVDDNFAFRSGLRSLLESDWRNFQVLEAANGSSARAVLNKQHVALALVDVHLQYEDGVSVAAALRKAYPQTVIILMSDLSEKRLALLARRAAVVGYLPKYLRATLLIDTIYHFAEQGAPSIQPNPSGQQYNPPSPYCS